MNLGSSNELKEAFPDILPVSRPLVVDQKIKDPAPHTKCGVTDHRPVRGADPYWLSGFTDAEGMFFINIQKSSGYKSGAQVILKFQITQHSRDEELLKSLVSYLGCGYYNASKRVDYGGFIVTRFSDIYDKIIPLLSKFPMHGNKRLDFADFVLHFLANNLKDKYDLQTSDIKAGSDDQWKISIPKESMQALASIIGKYVMPEMYYKLYGYINY
jgi:hypothetical protein